MKEEQDDSNELFRRMADKLRDHTEPYSPGAWERFVAKQSRAKTARKVYWPYWAAAAVVLITTVAVGWFNWGDDVMTDAGSYPAVTSIAKEESKPLVLEEGQQVMKRPEKSVLQYEQTPEQLIVNDGIARTMAAKSFNPDELQQDVVVVSVAATQSTEEPLLLEQEDAEVSLAQISIPSEHKNSETTALMVTENSQEEKILPSPPPIITESSLVAGYETQHVADNMQHKKWNIGLAVAPSVTSEKMNIGAGVVVAYRISDKFSISSGFSVSEMGVGRYPESHSPNRQFDGVYASPVTSEKDVMNGKDQLGGYEKVGSTYMTSMTSSLLAIDMPLDLRYHLNSRFYSAVGLSLLAVLDEDRTVHYATDYYQPMVNNGGQTTMKRDHIQFSQRADVQPVADQRYGGFVNFSLGHRMPLSRKLSVSVEPFFKFPIGGLTRQDMNLTHGGVRIATGF